MALEFTTSYMADSLTLFRHYKRLAERAIDQVSDAELNWAPAPGANSIAIIVKHMAGNMRSRWTDFLTSDGEKPHRRRDAEFEDPPEGRSSLMALWESGWDCLFQALGPLTDADLSRAVLIRGERHSVLQAINRQLAHYSYHVGQIAALGVQLRGEDWKSLTVPRGQSASFEARVRSGEVSQR